MPFQKAAQRPPNSGRKKGSKNKRTQETLARVNHVLSILDKNLAKDIKAMSPSQRVTLYTDLLEYQIPKLARTEHSGQVENVTYNIDLKSKDIESITKAFHDDY